MSLFQPSFPPAVHHPVPELLAAYAAGSLDEGRGLLIATHLALCPRCRRDVARFECVGGGVLDALPPTPMDDHALDAVLARLDGIQERRRPASGKTAPGAPPPLLPQPLRDYVGGSLETLSWRRMGGGIEQATLLERAGTRARLFRIQGGVRIPDHGHHGNELTLVLAGGFTDPSGHYARGDVADVGSDTEHHPVADPGEVCVCLAVTDAPLRLTGLVGRLLNPFLKL